MKINKITNYINDIVFGIFGIIDLLLILRIMLKLIAASTKSSFVNLVYNSTEGFVNVFEGTIGNIQAGNLILEIDTFIAVFVYFAIGLGLFKLLQAAFEKESYEKIRLALDTLFKVGEVTLGMRFFFKLVGAGDSKFIKILYDISGVFYKPFEGLLPSADADKFIFETATLVAIIIIIIIDIVTENLFKETKKRHIDIKEEEVKIKTNTETKPEQPQSIPVQNPSPTNIVIENQKPSTPVIKQQKPKLKTQIIKILEEKDGQSAIIEIDKILSPIFYKNPNELTRAEKNIVLVEEFEREMNNGGFSQFFSNSSGSYAHETLSALSNIHSVSFTKLLKQAIDEFPNGIVPKIHETRQKIIFEINEKAKPVWDKLDTEFYKYEDNIYQLMIDYIKENIGDFR